MPFKRFRPGIDTVVESVCIQYRFVCQRHRNYHLVCKYDHIYIYFNEA